MSKFLLYIIKMLNELRALYRYRIMITPVIIILLTIYSWDYLLVLLDIPLTSMLLMLVLAGMSLFFNALVIKRVTYRFHKYVSIKDSLWMTSVGILGNSLGLPIGTGVKYYFWVTRIGLKIRSSLFGIGYFSFLSFGSAVAISWILVGSQENIEYFWLGLSLFVAFLVFGGGGIAALLFEGWSSKIFVDWLLALMAVSFMAVLFTLPLAYYYPHIDIVNVFSLSFGFLALSYLTFVSSIPAGQEFLSGIVALFLGDDFMLGVGVSLSVRVAYVVCAGVIALLFKAEFEKA